MTQKAIRSLLIFILSLSPIANIWASEPPTIHPYDAKKLNQAFELIEKNNDKLALHKAKQSSETLAIPLTQWYSYVQSNNTASFRDIASFIEEYPHWPSQDTLKRRAEQSLDNTVPDNVLLAWFEKHPPTTAVGMWKYANTILRHQNNNAGRTKAYELIRSAWVDGNFTTSEEKTFYKEHSGILTDKDHVARIDRLLWNERIEQAKRILHLVSKGHQKLFNARIKVMRNMHGMDSAISAIPSQLQNDAGLIYSRVAWRDRRDKEDGVQELLFQLPDTIAQPDKLWRYIEKHTRILLRKKRYNHAYKLISNHKQTDKVEYIKAEWLAGWIALRFLDKPDTAYNHFKNVYDNVSYPISVSRAAYWLGRSAERSTQYNAKAGEWYHNASQYPTTFYGQLAHTKLYGTQPISWPQMPTYTPEDVARYQQNDLLRAAYLLITAHQNGLSHRFIKQAAEEAKSAGELRLIGEFGTLVDRPDFSVKASSIASYGNTILLDSHYPILDNLSGNTQSLALIHSLIRQESNFEKDARSSAGALGLMQLMPSTARYVAKSVNLPYRSAKLATDPSYNVQLGTAYINMMLAKFGGSYILALASYNAGPGNVGKWLDSYGDPRLLRSVEDKVDWVESIPFYETRNYVQRILEAMPVYHKKFNEGGSEIELVLHNILN